MFTSYLFFCRVYFSHSAIAWTLYFASETDGNLDTNKQNEDLSSLVENPAGECPADSWHLELQEAIGKELSKGEESNESRITEIFSSIRDGSKLVGDWMRKVNQLLLLPLNQKKRLLWLVAAGKYLNCDSMTADEVNKLVLSELLSPCIQQFESDTCSASKDLDNQCLDLLNGFLQDAAAEVKKRARLRLYGKLNRNQFSFVVHLHKRFVAIYEGMKTGGKLPTILKKQIEKPNRDTWYPFRGIPAVARLAELQDNLTPLTTTYSDKEDNDDADKLEVLRRDATNIDANEIIAIIEGIEQFYLHRTARRLQTYKDDKGKSVKGSGLDPFRYISKEAVDYAVKSMMKLGRLKRIVEDRYCLGDLIPAKDEDSEDDVEASPTGNGSPGAKKKQIPARYDDCMLRGRDNLSDYKPGIQPFYFSEFGRQHDHHLKAQSFAATKIVKEGAKHGIPWDFMLPSGRALRLAFGLDSMTTNMVQPMKMNLVFLMSKDGLARLEVERAAGSIPHTVAPAVVAFDCPVSEELRQAFVRHQNTLHWIVDYTSKGDGRCFNAPFLSPFAGQDSHLKIKNPNNPLAPDVFQYPIAAVGTNRGILMGQPDFCKDPFLFAFANDLVNMFINGANYVLAQMKEQRELPRHVPRPALFIRADKFYKYLIKVNDRNTKFFTRETDGLFHFHPLDDEEKYFPGALASYTHAQKCAEESGWCPVASPNARASIPFPTAEEPATCAPKSRKRKAKERGKDMASQESNAEPPTSFGNHPQPSLQFNEASDVDHASRIHDAPGLQLWRSLNTTREVSSPAEHSTTESATVPEPPHMDDDWFVPNQDLNGLIKTTTTFFESFGYHQDASKHRAGQLTSQPGNPQFTKPYAGKPSLKFPERKLMVVFTLLQGDDLMEVKTAVDFKLQEVGGSWLGGVVTGNNSAHMQLWGCQYYMIFHGANVFVHTKNPRYHGARLICTFRMMMDPNREPEAFLFGAHSDGLLICDRKKRQGYNLLYQPTFTNAISYRCPLASISELQEEDLCINRWNASDNYTDSRANNLFPAGIPENRKHIMLRPRNCLLKLTELMLGYFQREKVPSRDISHQNDDGFFNVGNHRKSFGNDSMAIHDTAFEGKNRTAPVEDESDYPISQQLAGDGQAPSVLPLQDSTLASRMDLDGMPQEGAASITDSSNGSVSAPYSTERSGVDAIVHSDSHVQIIKGCIKPLRTCQISARRSKLAYHSLVVEKALIEGKILRVVDRHNRPLVPTIFQLHRKILSGATPIQICDIPVPQNDSSHTPTNKDHSHVFVLTQKYKQILELLILHWRLQLKMTEIMDQPFDGSIDDRISSLENQLHNYFLLLFRNPLPLLGTGGSTQKDGSNVSKLPSTKRLKAHVHVGKPQSVREEANACMLQNYESGAVVSVILNCDLLFKKKTSNEKKKKNANVMDSGVDRNLGNGLSQELIEEVLRLELPSLPHKDTMTGALFLSQYKICSFQGLKDSISTTFGFGDGDIDSLRYKAAELQNYTFRQLGHCRFMAQIAFQPATYIRIHLRNKFPEKFKPDPALSKPGELYSIVDVSVQDSRFFMCKVSDCQKKMLAQLLSNEHGNPFRFWPLPPLSKGEDDVRATREIIGCKVAEQRKSITSSRSKSKNQKWTKAKLFQEIESFAFKSHRPDQLPQELIPPEAILAVVFEDTNFVDSMRWSSSVEDEIKKDNYRLSVMDIFNASMIVSYKVARRAADPKCCIVPADQMREICGLLPLDDNIKIRGRSRANVAYSTPIHNIDRPEITETAMPMTNIKPTPTDRDLDVSTNFFFNQLQKFGLHLHAERPSDAPDLLSSGLLTKEKYGGGENDSDLPFAFGRGHACPDWTARKNLKFLLSALFKATVFRHTGNTNYLELYPEWREQRRKEPGASSSNFSFDEEALPTNDANSLAEFSLFMTDTLAAHGNMEKSAGLFISKQHTGMIHSSLQCLLMLLTFMKQLLPEFQFEEDAEIGHDGILAQYLFMTLGSQSSAGSVGSSINRLALLTKLVEAYSRAGNFEFQEQLFQLSHQVVLDVETFFLDFAGETTVDDVFPGFGGREGLQLVDFQKPADASREVGDKIKSLNRVRFTRHGEKSRLRELHKQCTERIKASRSEREVFHMVLDVNGVLRHRLSGRRVSLSDTEHKEGCKIDIVSRMAETSRTGADVMESSSNYTYPRANPKPWDIALRSCFMQVISAYEHLPENVKLLPIQFVPPESRQITEKEWETMKLAKEEDGYHQIIDKEEYPEGEYVEQDLFPEESAFNLERDNADSDDDGDHLGNESNV